MENRHGLDQLYAPPEGTKVTADVVFVHGLFGHPRKTWTGTNASGRATASSSSNGTAPENSSGKTSKRGRDRSVLWPQTLLPTVIPDARIFTYGYDADIDGILTSASQNTTNQHALNILHDLADLRQTPYDKAIPIIFVAHSLGGIVVKDALNESRSEEESRVKDIVPSVIGVCFLGTPHRGSKAASLGRRAYRLTEIISKRPNLRLLQGLERNSETLDRIGRGFIQTLQKHKRISICSFREEMETRKFLFFNLLVVPADSAKIRHEREEVNSIPTDHGNMAKFASASDVGFRRVTSQLRRWIAEIKVHHDISPQDRDDCLESLRDRVTRARMETISEPHEKTFHWLFDSNVVDFPDWLKNTTSPIYWIQGKPGSGKSTLMKFAMNDKRMSGLLESDTGDSWTLAAFFFHDRGSEMQKSLVGMLQELVGSILYQIPALTQFAIPAYKELVRSQRIKNPMWNFEALKSTLIAMVQQQTIRLRLCLLLDALDEHDGDNDRLAELLRDLINKASPEWVEIKLCLASRSWSVFEKHFGDCPGFTIHNHTSQDIRTYIETRLEPSCDQDESPANREWLTRIVGRVADKAMGVFIWVRLVVDLISKGIWDGTSYDELEDSVEQVPQELKDLYADTLKRVELRYATEGYIMLHMALCSQIPLPLEVFMACLDINCSVLLRGTRGGAGAFRLASAKSLELHKRRLASRTGGLLETISVEPSSGHPDGDDPNTFSGDGPFHVVQFIHQTVKEYIDSSRRDLPLSGIPPQVQQENGHLFLLTSCSQSHHDWISCVKRDILVYVQRANAETDGENGCGRIAGLFGRALSDEGPIDLDWLLTHMPLPISKLINGNDKYKDDLFIHKIAKLAVAATLTESAKHFCIMLKSEPNNKVFILWDLMAIAVTGPHLNKNSATAFDIDSQLKMIRMLADSGCPINERVLESVIFANIPWLAPIERWDLTSLGVALSSKDQPNDVRLAITKQLLELRSDPNAEVHFDDPVAGRCSTLDYCICFHSADIVRLLVQYGAILKPHQLRLAYMRGDKTVIQALLDLGLGESLRKTYFVEESVSHAIFIFSNVVLAPAGICGASVDGMVPYRNSQLMSWENYQKLISYNNRVIRWRGRIASFDI